MVQGARKTVTHSPEKVRHENETHGQSKTKGGGKTTKKGTPYTQPPEKTAPAAGTLSRKRPGISKN